MYGSWSHKVRTARTWIVSVLVLASVLRGLVPSGYMPDFSALSRGAFATVICHGDQLVPVVLDEKGQPLQKNAPDSHQPCAFSKLAATGLPALWTHSSGPQSPVADKLTVFATAVLAPARVGPVLGSRGPPHFS